MRVIISRIWAVPHKLHGLYWFLDYFGIYGLRAVRLYHISGLWFAFRLFRCGFKCFNLNGLQGEKVRCFHAGSKTFCGIKYSSWNYRLTKTDWDWVEAIFGFFKLWNSFHLFCWVSAFAIKTENLRMRIPHWRQEEWIFSVSMSQVHNRTPADSFFLPHSKNSNLFSNIFINLLTILREKIESSLYKSHYRLKRLLFRLQNFS